MKYDFSKPELNDILNRMQDPKQLEFDYGVGETWYETMKKKQTAWADYEFVLTTKSLKKDCSPEGKTVLHLIHLISSINLKNG